MYDRIDMYACQQEACQQCMHVNSWYVYIFCMSLDPAIDVYTKVSLQVSLVCLLSRFLCRSFDHAIDVYAYNKCLGGGVYAAMTAAVYTHMYIYIKVCIYIYKYMHIYICMHVYINICMCVYIHTYIYAYIYENI